MPRIFSRLFVSRQTLRQYGALCYRAIGANCEIALVTSRGTGRFVIPKGWPEPGLEPYEAAAREAEEEAGLVGEICRRSVGSYDYSKRLHLLASLTCRVDVFPMRVTVERERWSEDKERKRTWFAPEDAANAVREWQLGEIIRTFARDRQSGRFTS